MSKDPAFLFYSADFIVGTLMMTNEQIGQYIKLLCLQHQQGHLAEDNILAFTQTKDSPVFQKFIKDPEGRYYNQRLEEESSKRKAYCKSRSNSRRKADEDSVKIYLIKDSVTGYIKIGSSVNPLRRLSEMLNQKSPATLAGEESRGYSLIYTSPVTIRSSENELHKYYENKRIQGEWFNLSDEDIEYIRNSYVQRMENENENVNKDIVVTRASIKDVFTYYLIKTKKKFKLTIDRMALIKKRLKEGYKVDDLKTAIDNFVLDDWEGRANHMDLIYCIGKQKGKPDALEKWLNKKGGDSEREKAEFTERLLADKT